MFDPVEKLAERLSDIGKPVWWNYYSHSHCALRVAREAKITIAISAEAEDAIFRSVTDKSLPPPTKAQYERVLPKHVAKALMLLRDGKHVTPISIMEAEGV